MILADQQQRDVRYECCLIVSVFMHEPGVSIRMSQRHQTGCCNDILYVVSCVESIATREGGTDQFDWNRSGHNIIITQFDFFFSQA